MAEDNRPVSIKQLDIALNSVLVNDKGFNNLSLNENPFLNFLKKKGCFERCDLGEVGHYNYEPNFTDRDGTSLSRLGSAEILKEAVWDFKAMPFQVVISSDELDASKSVEKIVDAVLAKLETGRSGFMNSYENALLSDGTVDNGLGIDGLDLVISKTPTQGIYGGRDRSEDENEFWRNQSFNLLDKDNGLNNNAEGFNVDNCLVILERIINKMPVKPDFILAGSEYYSVLSEAIMKKVSVLQTVGYLSLGFDAIEYKGCVVINMGRIQRVRSGKYKPFDPKKLFIGNTKSIKVKYVDSYKGRGSQTDASVNSNISEDVSFDVCRVNNADGQVLHKLDDSTGYYIEYISKSNLICTDPAGFAVVYEDDVDPDPEVLTIKADKPTYADGQTGTLSTSNADASVTVDNSTNITNLLQDATTKTKWTFKAVGDAQADKTAKFTVAKEGATSGSVSVNVSKKSA